MIDYEKFEGHTPGPWFVTDLKIYAPDPEMPGLPWVIAEINNDAFYEGANPAKPNAALMAAAPDLLAENKRLRKILFASIPYLEELQTENCADESVGIRYDQTLEDTLVAALAALNEQK